MANRIKPLTEQHRIFCRQYIFDWNVARSYGVAYPNVVKYDVQKSAGCRLLKRTLIKEYISYLQKNIEKTVGISRNMIIEEQMKLAFSSIAHLHNTWIERKEFEKLTEDQKACIAEITVVPRLFKDPMLEISVHIEGVKIKLWDKQKALEALSRMLGHNEPEKFQISGVTKQDLNKIFPTAEELANES